MLLGELDLNAGPTISSLHKVALGFSGVGRNALGAVPGIEGFGLASSVACTEAAVGLAEVDAAAAPLAAILAPLIVIGAAIAASFIGLKDVLDLGGTLNDLSLRTGESVGSLVILREAFAEAGLGADGVEPFLLKLQNALGGVNEEGNKTSDAFDALGVSSEQLGGLDAIGQIEALQKGFAGIADQATKVQVARNLFGKSGGQALSLLGDPQVLDDARKHAGPLAEIMEKNATTFDKLGDIVGSLKLDFQEFFAGALSKIAPEAITIADALDSIDFVGIGEAVGSLAGVVLKLGEAFLAIAPAVKWVSEMLSKLFGSGSSASAGLAEKYKGFAKLNQSGDAPGAKDSTVSSLQKVGRGGGYGGAGDPLLTEQRRHTSLLQEIRDRIGRGDSLTNALDPVPV